MQLFKNIKKTFQRLSYKYWVFKIKLKVYALKYKRVFELPYQ